MDPNDPVCYKCGRPGYKDYGYFLAQRSPDKKGEGASLKSLLFPGGSLTLGNYYTMVLCERCVKIEFVFRALIMMSVITGVLAVLFAAALLIWAGSGSFLYPAAVLAALAAFAVCCITLIIIKSRKSVSAAEGEACAARLYNRDHLYSTDGVFAISPGKAKTKFNI